MFKCVFPAENTGKSKEGQGGKGISRYKRRKYKYFGVKVNLENGTNTIIDIPAVKEEPIL